MTSTPPARERLNAADLRFLLICLLLLAGTVWFSARYFYRAFPEASIDFRVTRAESRGLAAKFLGAQGWAAAGYREASRFAYDDQAKTFLERELGLERANAIMGSRVRLWLWEWRWFRPKQKEEFRVAVTPRGEVVGAQHLIDEGAALPSLDSAQARAVAEQMLAAMGRDPGSLEFVEGSTTARPARTDHTFTWKERDFDVHDATYRIEVTVLGNRVGGYREYLKVPDAWQRSYEKLRSGNMAAQNVDTGLMLLVAVGLLIAILQRTHARDVKWGRAATVGAIGAALFFLSSLNSHSLNEFDYPTTDSYGNFIVRLFLQYAMGALGSGGLLFILTAGAEPLYRQYFGGRISLGNLFSARGLRTKPFLLGTVLGLTLTGIFVAYQTVFYMTAYRFGAWSPADVPYDDLLNTRLPWLYVLFGGFLPAVSEEFMFRMFAIPWMRKMFRSTVVAVVAAGFLWGFGHAAYPQQPFWIRGVEVGIGGVALGAIMLRWGILPVLVWHYSVDAMYTALLLMRSHNLYFQLSGAASAGFMVLPALVALVIYLRRGGFEPAAELTNAREGTAEPAHAEPAEAPAAPEYRRWTAARRWAALWLGAAGLLLLLVPVQKFGDEPRFALTADGARAAADSFLRARGGSADRFQTAAFPLDRWDEDNAYWYPRETARYMTERRPLAWVADAYSRLAPLRIWSVRYYKPLEKEEYRVSVHPQTGKITGFMHEIPEDRPGADLSPDAARKIAADYMAQAGYDPAAFELKETNSEKQKARRDYTLVWEAREGDARNVDAARFRVRTEVAGDSVSAMTAYWKLPEAWLRARTERNALSTALLVARIGVISGALVLVIWLLIGATRRHEIRWGTAVMLAAVPVALGVAGTLANVPLIWRGYNTAIAVEMFRVAMFTGVLVRAVGLFLGLVCACALILALHPAARKALTAPARRMMAVDGLCASVLALGLGAGAGQIGDLARAALQRLALFEPESPSALGAYSAAVSLAGGAATSTVYRLAVVALAVYLLQWAGRSGGRWVLLAMAGAAVLISGEVHSGAELALEAALVLVALAAAALLAWFLRGNYLGWLMAAWTLGLGARAAMLAAQPAAGFRAQGWALAGLLVLTLAWAAAPAVRGSKIPRSGVESAG